MTPQKSPHLTARRIVCLRPDRPTTMASSGKTVPTNRYLLFRHHAQSHARHHCVIRSTP